MELKKSVVLKLCAAKVLKCYQLIRKKKKYLQRMCKGAKSAECRQKTNIYYIFYKKQFSVNIDICRYIFSIFFCVNDTTSNVF